MPKPYHIVLAMPLDSDYARSAAQGIIKYSTTREDWLLSRCDPDGPILGQERPDGVIAMIETPGQFKCFGAGPFPVVNVCRALCDVHLPHVASDDRWAGEIAAGHFLERGMARFAYAGPDDRADAKLHLEGYRNRLASAGYGDVAVHHVHHNAPPETLARWVRSLARPTALFASSDALAAQIVHTARDSGLSVPADLAVLGCGNDPIICGMSSPQLSSISLPAERIGYEAAQLLQLLISGAKPLATAIDLPVSSVVPRGSTDVVSISDPHVAAAVRFILAHAGEWIGVPELLLAVPIQRRSLERKFRQALGRTPLQEIRRVRLEIARQLLSSTDLPMPLVARQSGFSEAKRLTQAFHDELKMTPTAYRAKYRVTVGS